MTLEKDYYSIFKVKNHAKHKENLINLIKKIPKNKYDNISHTDWNLSDQTKKEWQKYFLNNIFDQWSKFFNQKTKQQIILHNFWFQWYDVGDYHNWHVHTDTHFTNVYYLSLPNPNLKTSILAFNKEKNIKVKEGQILTFPAFWKHCSPRNIYFDPKIIISFNIDLD
jgi:hypothetical protein|tara:strand:+ start:403 stop:903 length:501 start_codon:yes stop_codon:yes gene_type:complete